MQDGAAEINVNEELVRSGARWRRQLKLMVLQEQQAPGAARPVQWTTDYSSQPGLTPPHSNLQQRSI